MEYWLTETALLAAIIDNNFNEYTCSTVERPFLSCLDIAAPSTLAGTIGSYAINSETDLLEGVTQTYLGVDADATNLFGTNELCGTTEGGGGKVQGDGILDVLDLAVLTWIVFSVHPYHQVTGNTFTVNGESDVSLRCEDNITRPEWLAEFDPATPCVIPSNLPPTVYGGRGRQLEEAEDDLHVSVHLHDVRTYGSWFHVRLDDTLIAVELLVDGVDTPQEINLKNLRAPYTTSDDNTHVPFDEGKLEIRYARHVEYIEGGESVAPDCAVIRGLVANGAMYRSTIGVGQVPTVQEGVDGVLLCPFDLFLYVPGAFDCSVNIAVGSRAMDGRTGRRMRHEARCDPTPYDFSTAHPPPPPPSSPSPPPLALDAPPPPVSVAAGASSAPPAAPDDETHSARVVLVAVVSVLTTLLVCCCVVAAAYLVLSRRSREERDGRDGPAAPPAGRARDRGDVETATRPVVVGSSATTTTTTTTVRTAGTSAARPRPVVATWRTSASTAPAAPAVPDGVRTEQRPRPLAVRRAPAASAVPGAPGVSGGVLPQQRARPLAVRPAPAASNGVRPEQRPRPPATSGGVQPEQRPRPPAASGGVQPEQRPPTAPTTSTAPAAPAQRGSAEASPRRQPAVRNHQALARARAAAAAQQRERLRAASTAQNRE